MFYAIKRNTLKNLYNEPRKLQFVTKRKSSHGHKVEQFSIVNDESKHQNTAFSQISFVLCMLDMQIKIVLFVFQGWGKITPTLCEEV